MLLLTGDELSKQGPPIRKGEAGAAINRNCYFEHSVAFKPIRQTYVREVFDWLDANTSSWSFDIWVDSSYSFLNYFSFEDGKEAMLFKLTFVGE